MRLSILFLCMLSVAVVGCQNSTPKSETEMSIESKVVNYTHDGVELQGYLAWPADAAEPKPGVLVIHEWWGHNEFAREQARRLAKLGYVAFALDMYGKDKLTDDAEQARNWATPLYQDRQLLRQRALAGLEQLKQSDKVDADKLAAIGFCFGGSSVLELARAEADVDVVVSFHGGLGTSAPAEKGSVKARVVSIIGADDPMIPDEEREAFKTEMEDADVSYRYEALPDAVHSFMNPDADKHGIDGVAYNEQAATKAWEIMKEEFEEQLK